MSQIETVPPLVAEPNWKRLLSRKAEREAAAEDWRAVTSEMERRNILSPTNGHAILRLVLARVMHDRAAAKAMRAGPVTEPAKGNSRAIARPSLYFAAMREAAAVAAQLESDLGLSPRTREKVGKIPRQARESAAARFLRPVPNLPRPAAELPPVPVVTTKKEPSE